MAFNINHSATITSKPTYSPQSVSSEDELTRILNTAVISTHAKKAQDLSQELNILIHTPEFKAILGAIRQVSIEQNISEKLSAEKLVETFRNLDKIWNDYVFLEGIEKLRCPKP